jgi:hypothetical protein
MADENKNLWQRFIDTMFRERSTIDVETAIESVMGGWRPSENPEYLVDEYLIDVVPTSTVRESDMTYDQLYTQFQESDFAGSFTDWMVQKLGEWEAEAQRRTESLERRIAVLESPRAVDTVPYHQYEILQQQYNSAMQQLEQERVRNASRPSLRYTRGVAAPPPNRRDPDTLRRLDALRQQTRDLRISGELERALEEYMRNIGTDLDGAG